jgi:putative transposase
MYRCAAFAINGSNQAIGIARSTASHRHEGRITVQTSNTCDAQTALRLVALDYCEREAIDWVASPTGYSGDNIRDLMAESVEKGKRHGSELIKTIKRDYAAHMP